MARSFKPSKRDAQEPANVELLEKMTQYSLGNFVREMMQVMMERLILAQPNDPLEFMIDVIQNDPKIIAIDQESRYNRMDLRSFGTKMKYLRLLFQVIAEDKAPAIPKATFLDSLMSINTSKCLQRYFPCHATNLINIIVSKEHELPDLITFDTFAVPALEALSRK